MIKSKILILGSGPAGYTAGIYAARACLEPILLTGASKGGQLTTTTDVENYTGFPKPVQGSWLMEQMEEHAKNVGVKIIEDTATSVNLKTSPFEIITANNSKMYTDALIIATGAVAKWLNLPSENKFRGYGVSGCATCDGFFYRGKEVAVVGGGNTALEEALYLCNHASKVTLIHRRGAFRGDMTMQQRVINHPKINIIWNHVVDEIIGDDNPKSVTALNIKNAVAGTISTLPINGVFIAIGHKPNTDLFRGQIDLDNDGYIKTQAGTSITNISGVFAAGDVQDKIYRQAITSAGSGCIAALDAEKYLSSTL
ncbi:thioredoxin-disulfide reductase [Candidatus Fokinia crypta]|uniref:Thioredoxin reductase n=1 Tax=Candidatus Fokinia crypta TaxID=1920990 RepID=A0ABZ0US61_9RICK|nr:thioredoxin-disulfide reductase [Candidatus Fokinia cryptica]WPX97859.1 Thioredoxin reductase [Candidatus Fokinia cryptica]